MGQKTMKKKNEQGEQGYPFHLQEKMPETQEPKMIRKEAESAIEKATKHRLKHNRPSTKHPENLKVARSYCPSPFSSPEGLSYWEKHTPKYTRCTPIKTKEQMLTS